MTKTYEFPIKLLDLNAYLALANSHRCKANKYKSDTQDILRKFILSQKVKHFTKKVDVHIDFFEKKRNRDKDNLLFALKLILDAFQQIGVLDGDGWKNIGDIVPRYYISKEEGYKYDYGVIVTLKEVE